MMNSALLAANVLALGAIIALAMQPSEPRSVVVHHATSQTQARPAVFNAMDNTQSQRMDSSASVHVPNQSHGERLVF